MTPAISADNSLALAENERISRKRRRKAVLAAWAFGFAVAGVYYAVHDVPAAGWRLHDVTTSATPEYPALQSRLYDSSPENTTVLTAAAASRVLNWKVLRTDTAAHQIDCEVKTGLGLLTDDVNVTVEPSGQDGSASLVRIRSHSRLGAPDLGMNARHISDLQAAMDDKLPRITP